MLATRAASRNAYCCLSSAFGSFWRAAKRNSPASAERGAKSQFVFFRTTRRIPHASAREAGVDSKFVDKTLRFRARLTLLQFARWAGLIPRRLESTSLSGTNSNQGNRR
jgi:hypothetical protein